MHHQNWCQIVCSFTAVYVIFSSIYNALLTPGQHIGILLEVTHVFDATCQGLSCPFFLLQWIILYTE